MMQGQGRTSYSVWEFSEKEIGQIVELIEVWSGGSLHPADARKFSGNVRKYALSTGLLCWHCRHYDWTGPIRGMNGTEVYRNRSPWMDSLNGHDDVCRLCKSRNDWRLYPGDSRMYRPECQSPPEVLWRIVEQHLYHDTGEPKGFSLANDRKLWARLNIYAEGMPYLEECRHDPSQREFANRQYVAKLTVLNRLAEWGYIWFQYAGSVWQITVREEM